MFSQSLISSSSSPLMATTSIVKSNAAVNGLYSSNGVEHFLPHLASSSISLHRPSPITFLSRKLATINGTAPIVRAQISPESLPDSKFYKVEAILRPWRIQQVSSALLKMGIRGVTVSDVRGFGSQGGLTERQFGSEFSEDNFVAKVKMEIVVSKDQVDAVIEKIIEEARTGEIGDGKIFVLPVSDVIRVRTGERGEKAERMVGGRADMFSNGLSA